MNKKFLQMYKNVFVAFKTLSHFCIVEKNRASIIRANVLQYQKLIVS
ncbi:MAG: hypothetical protein RL742_788 [Bacteroidota bacterium]|jgi:hypothetical protein